MIIYENVIATEIAVKYIVAMKIVEPFCYMG